MNSAAMLPQLHINLCKSHCVLRSPTAAQRYAPAGANRCLHTTSTTAPGSATPCRSPPSATQNVHAPGVCNSTKNATASVVATRLVRVAHPFHPLSGRELLCVGERYNRYGMTLLLETDDGAVCAVRPQWTDVVAPDPEIVLGGQRALFRVADLLELTRLVDWLSGRDSSGR